MGVIMIVSKKFILLLIPLLLIITVITIFVHIEKSNLNDYEYKYMEEIKLADIPNESVSLVENSIDNSINNNDSYIDAENSLAESDIDDIMQNIDERVLKINENLVCPDGDTFSKDCYDGEILVYRRFACYFDHESSASYILYYDEYGYLIYADITHYRGALYSIYFHNDKLLHVEVGPFLTGESFINGGIENVESVIKKDDFYLFVLEDITICLEKAYYYNE